MRTFKTGFIFMLTVVWGLTGLVFFCRLGGEAVGPTETVVGQERPSGPGDGGAPPGGEPEIPETPIPPESEPEPEPVLMASEHFAMEEYRCDCAGYCDGWPVFMEPELLEKIEALRRVFGQPIIITSGVRCAARNAEVGGVSWSFHKRGRAADLYCPGVAVGDLAAGAKACGLNVLPYYRSGYIHVEI